VTNTCPCCKAAFNNLTKIDPSKPAVRVRPKFIPNKKQVYEFDVNEFMDNEYDSYGEYDEDNEMADFIVEDDVVDDDASFSIFYCPEELGNSRDMFDEAEEINVFDDRDFIVDDDDASFEPEVNSIPVRGSNRPNFWREFLSRLPEPGRLRHGAEVTIRSVRTPTRPNPIMIDISDSRETHPLSKRRRVVDLTEESPIRSSARIKSKRN